MSPAGLLGFEGVESLIGGANVVYPPPQPQRRRKQCGLRRGIRKPTHNPGFSADGQFFMILAVSHRQF